MAQYTGFNDTCDQSALLGLIINIDKFPQSVQAVAQQVCILFQIVRKLNVAAGKDNYTPRK